MSVGAWTALGSCATAVMAIATFVLAYKTRTMATATAKVANETATLATETKAVAEATLSEASAVFVQGTHMERQVEISSTALRASVRPWLVWDPSFTVDNPRSPSAFVGRSVYMSGTHSCLQVSERQDSVTGWLRVRNVGTGIALVDMSCARIYPRNDDLPLLGAQIRIDTPVIPPSATADLVFELPASLSKDNQKMTLLQLVGGGPDELFAVEIAYSDTLGGETTRLIFRAHRRGQGWGVFESEYRLENGQKVIARRQGR